eukprot:PRCOL_00000110-RA
MVRGNAKAKSQEKNAKKQAAKQRSGSQLNDQKKALKFVCPVCKVQMPQVKTMLVHWDSKHGKVPEPQEIKDMRTSVA